MDTGEGRFHMFDHLSQEKEVQEKFPNHGGTFHLGKVLEIEGSKFRVISINPTTITLKLLKKR